MSQAGAGNHSGQVDNKARRNGQSSRESLEQFRERNFILSRFGAEVYGFVHRAFLEYLAAADIVDRLAERELTEDELTTEVFGRR